MTIEISTVKMLVLNVQCNCASAILFEKNDAGRHDVLIEITACTFVVTELTNCFFTMSLSSDIPCSDLSPSRGYMNASTSGMEVVLVV